MVNDSVHLPVTLNPIRLRQRAKTAEQELGSSIYQARLADHHGGGQPTRGPPPEIAGL